MAIISCFDLDGVEHQREAIDARECVALGWTLEKKVNKILPAEIVAVEETKPLYQQKYGKK